jgi:hypothetical protein
MVRPIVPQRGLWARPVPPDLSLPVGARGGGDMRGSARGEFQGPGEGSAESHSRGTEALAPYDAERDFAESINECYRAVRERVARGGRPWVPPPSD